MKKLDYYVVEFHGSVEFHKTFLFMEEAFLFIENIKAGRVRASKEVRNMLCLPWNTSVTDPSIKGLWGDSSHGVVVRNYKMGAL